MTFILLISVGLLTVSLVAAIALSSHSIWARISASVIALWFAAFCGFGFLASFELSGSPLSLWHLAYAIAGLGSLVAAFPGMRSAWIALGLRRA